MDFTKLFERWPAPIHEVINFMMEQGYHLYLVGGPVRDFVSQQVISTDLDFEIQHSDSFEHDEWVEKIAEIQSKLHTKFSYPIEKLPFGIFKMEIEKFQCEFASARVETYEKGKKNYHHSEFNARLIGKLDVQQALARRDFSVNAIAFDLKNQVLIDPWHGLEDIKKKKLTPVHRDFEKDPVRFLRAFRFKHNLNFEFSDELRQKCQQMDLTQLSDYSVQKEIFKAHKPLEVLLSIKTFTQKNSIALPTHLLEVLKLPFLQRPKKISFSEHLMTDLALLTEGEMEQKHQHMLCDFFRWKRKDFKSLLTLATDLICFEQFDSHWLKKTDAELFDLPLIQSARRILEQPRPLEAKKLALICQFTQGHRLVSERETNGPLWQRCLELAQIKRDQYALTHRSLVPTLLYLREIYES